MNKDYTRDRKELPGFAAKMKGYNTLEVIEAYAKKRRVGSHRIGSAFWDLVDEGRIETVTGNNGIEYVK